MFATSEKLHTGLDCGINRRESVRAHSVCLSVRPLWLCPGSAEWSYRDPPSPEPPGSDEGSARTCTRHRPFAGGEGEGARLTLQRQREPNQNVWATQKEHFPIHWDSVTIYLDELWLDSFRFDHNKGWYSDKLRGQFSWGTALVAFWRLFPVDYGGNRHKQEAFKPGKQQIHLIVVQFDQSNCRFPLPSKDFLDAIYMQWCQEMFPPTCSLSPWENGVE